MKKKTFIIANWKMNLSLSDSSNFLKKICKFKMPLGNLFEIVICPQFLLIPNLSKLLGSIVKLGAQDCHYATSGAFTGDSSIKLLKYFKCKYVIAGHSERRILHKESNIEIKKKVTLISSEGLTPILCVGELLNERKKKLHKQKIISQLQESIPTNLKNIIIAYEPIWSIGTGTIPSVYEITEVTEIIFNFLRKYRNHTKFHIIYGGSVDSINFRKISEIQNINGALIGGSSLKYNELKKIVSSIN